MANNPRNEPLATKAGAEPAVDDAVADVPERVADAEEPVPVDLLLPVLVPEALAADPVSVDPEAVDSGTPVCVVVMKLEVMQAFTQSEYFWLSATEPLPWAQSATHLLVAFTAAVSGLGTPTHAAWQSTSPGLQAFMHC